MQMRIHYKIHNYKILPQYATIPIDFMVESILKVTPIGEGGFGGYSMVEEKVDIPYCKDLDARPGFSPMDWPNHYDVSDWIFTTMWDGDLLIGGCTIGEVYPNGSAVIFDHRLRPEYRHAGKTTAGIGTNMGVIAYNDRLSKGCRLLVTQNQNTNVPGCKHIIRKGGVLAGISTVAPDLLPGEIQLSWKCLLPPDPIPMVPVEEIDTPETTTTNTLWDIPKVDTVYNKKEDGGPAGN